ncbi:hypothetical protein C8P66_11733 [Humitalea rosea]|uniref:Uncharacterized protein n=1 Tax=Humitalea rosea TaxID=990373 RepID=A0A2W7IA56_9PROT|nr:hypothetical protein [Humitalea rosea]PZW43008.1 hypothetical protein C8P66_11733 [Humitalea rosea]
MAQVTAAQAGEMSATVEVVMATLLLPVIEVTTQGHALAVDWGSTPPGATRVEVTSASLALTPLSRDTTLGALQLAKDGRGYKVTAPTGRRLTRIVLHGLKAGESSLSDRAKLVERGLRLAVAVPDGSGRFTPTGATPGVPGAGLVPPLPQPGYTAGVLDLGSNVASRLRLSLVTGDGPDRFTEDATMALERVEGVAADPPLDLKLAGESGAPVLWAFPGEMPSGGAATQADLRVAVETALQAAVDAGAAPRLPLRLTAGRASQLRLASFQAHGTLIRRIASVPTLEIQGEAAPLPAEAPLPERPNTATADLSLRYLGIRLVPELSDAVPGGPVLGPVFGHVVGTAEVVRSLPPQALRGARLARIGLVGRAPEAAALVLTLRNATTGAAIGAPVKLALEAARDIATRWVEVPEEAPIDVPLAVALRATSGRFLWSARDDDGAPRLRLAVHDPDPGGRPLLLGGASLLTVDTMVLRQRGVALPSAGFAGHWPMLSSELFLTLDLADLTLRYVR